jgi:predicted ArsR family transcriptional regulator
VSIQWGPLEVLADKTRRALYEHVRRTGAVTRDQAAGAVGISRGLAAFHLDKLVAAGLLAAAYEAAAPRRRGRAPKVYRATEDELGFTLPGRRYDLMGEILAEAIDTVPAEAHGAAHGAALQAAYRRGREAGGAERQTGGRLERLLERLGFEPDGQEQETVRLRNCPFQRLAARHTVLICGLNQAFVAGILHGIEATTLRAELAPAAGFCCVRLSPAT